MGSCPIVKLLIPLKLKEPVRHVVFYGHYFEEFFTSLPEQVKDKFVWTFELISQIELIPKPYLKHVQSGVYEIRVKAMNNQYRAFVCFDSNRVVVLNGFKKKTRKTPSQEIKRAIRIRNEYIRGKP